MRCPRSEKKSTRWPSTVDQCEHCGKMVRTRRDGTYAKHDLPKEMQDEGRHSDNHPVY